MDIKSPFLILIEMLEGLVSNFVSSFQLIYYKMAELFISLSFISGLGAIGFIASILIGSVVGFLIIKFVFGTSKELFYISLFYFLLLILFSISLVST
jgi:hypothetical protein